MLFLITETDERWINFCSLLNTVEVTLYHNNTLYNAQSRREQDLPVIVLNILLGVACLYLSSRWETALIKIHYQCIRDWWQSRRIAWESVIPSKSNAFPTGIYRQFSNEGETPDLLLLRGKPCTWAGETSERIQRCHRLVVFTLRSWTYTMSFELLVSE